MIRETHMGCLLPSELKEVKEEGWDGVRRTAGRDSAEAVRKVTGPA